MLDIFLATVQWIALLFIFTFHNYIKAYTAVRLGDPTPKQFGFLTLNPIPHIDIFGTVILPAIFLLMKSPLLIGWPKMVPINYGAFKDHRFAALTLTGVSIFSYFAIALLGLLLYKVINFLPLPYSVETPLETLFQFITLIGAFFGFLNLLPIPPMDMGVIVLLLLGKNMYEINSYALYGSIAVLFLFISGILGYLFKPIYLFLISLF